MAAVADRRIEGHGTPAAAWAACPILRALPTCSADTLVTAGQRAVIVAPHPDDEVLGVGGLIHDWVDNGTEVLVIGVTDGEAGLPPGDAMPAFDLAGRRRGERVRGLAQLGLSPSAICGLGLPDGGVHAQGEALSVRLAAQLRRGDVVFTTWRCDGHPDHEATSASTARACAAVGAVLHEVPVWMWHWAAPGDAQVPWHALRRVALSPKQCAAKRRAIAEHVSQLTAEDGSSPVLPGWALARWLRPWEFVFAAGAVAGGDMKSMRSGR